MYCLTGHIASAVECGRDLGDLERIAMKAHFPTVGAGGGLHSKKGGRGHLATGHPVDGVVDEYDRDVLSPVESVDRLSGSDAGEVSVTLVGEDQPVRPEALCGAGECRCPSVGGLLPVHVDILVGEDGTADRRDRDGLVRHPHLLDNLGDKFVHHTVAAARAIVHRGVIQEGRLLVDDLTFLYDFFSCHGFLVLE